MYLSEELFILSVDTFSFFNEREVKHSTKDVSIEMLEKLLKRSTVRIGDIIIVNGGYLELYEMGV